MGESNSKPQVDNDFLRNFERDYKEIGEELDNRLGNVKVFQNGQGDCVATKNAFAQNKEDIENFLSTSLAKALNINCKYLAKLHSYKIHTDDSMCGSVNGITTYHQYFQNTVQDELIRRNQVNLYYQEQELWAILYSIISASAYLETNKHLPLSDVRPCNVYFTPRGEVKLMPFGTFLEDQSAYVKSSIQFTPAFLSPEQLDKLSHRNSNNLDISQEKSDVYAIGMTLLNCATLQTEESCYNFNEYVIDKGNMSGLFEFMRNQYSRFLCNIISIMLSENPEDRPTPSTVLSILQPYETEILALKTFNPDKQIIKESLDAHKISELALNEKQNDRLFSVVDEQVDDKLLHGSTFVQVQTFKDNDVIYNRKQDEGKYEYLIQTEAGKPIERLEEEFFQDDIHNQRQHITEQIKLQQKIEKNPQLYAQPQYVYANQQQQYIIPSQQIQQSQVVDSSVVFKQLQNPIQSNKVSTYIAPQYDNQQQQSVIVSQYAYQENDKQPTYSQIASRAAIQSQQRIPFDDSMQRVAALNTGAYSLPAYNPNIKYQQSYNYISDIQPGQTNTALSYVQHVDNNSNINTSPNYLMTPSSQNNNYANSLSQQQTPINQYLYQNGPSNKSSQVISATLPAGGSKYHESAYYDLNEINRRVDTALLNTKDAIRQSQAGSIQRI